jgi:hypothetical protein
VAPVQCRSSWVKIKKLSHELNKQIPKRRRKIQCNSGKLWFVLGLSYASISLTTKTTKDTKFRARSAG